jgi:creatinine amidohydrolase/Fe(II)-dependent formamide hydrolase-like protein
VKFVPEGDIETKTIHMASPGTISMREDTFRAILRDTAESLQAHGFKNIIFIGDSGGNQAGQKAIAEELTAKWAGKALAVHVAEYYDYAGVAAYMKSHGIVDGASDNMHDDPIITLNMFADDPNSVRYNERVKAGKASINGVSVADKAKNTALARQIVEFRATRTVDAINRLIAAKKPSTASQD